MNEPVTITADNYEEFLMLQADGELDPAAENALADWLKAHPEEAAELAVYESLRLQPDETVAYAGKDALLRAAPVQKRIPLVRLRYAAAAALLLGLLGAAAVWRSSRPASDSPALAVNSTGTALRHIYHTQSSQRTRTRPVPARRSSGGKSIRPEGPVRLARVQRVRLAPMPAVAPQQPARVLLPGSPALLPEAAPASLLAYEAIPPAAALPAEAGAQPVLVLPVANLLREEAGERWQQLRSTARAVKDASLALRIGNKDLFTIRL